MRIARVRDGSTVRWGALVQGGVAPLPFATVDELADWARSDAAPGPASAEIALGSEPPIRPPQIIGVGLNYVDHAAEVGADLPERPLLFAKPPTSVIGAGVPIRVDRRVTTFPDWEVELAVVVGQRMQRVALERALDYVLGYTVANDVTARDIQQADGQWFRAKSLGTFCPLGPWIVTPDEIGDPQTLGLSARVNGELVQRSTTEKMCFSVAELLTFCSRHFVLEPGDVLLTGTPSGVGMSMAPPRSLRAGDVVEVEVERIGTLRNPVEEIPDV